MRRLALAVTLVAAATLVSSTSAMAQAAKKKQRQRISPHETITATIDGDEVKLVYGRPYTKDPRTGEAARSGASWSPTARSGARAPTRRRC